MDRIDRHVNITGRREPLERLRGRLFDTSGGCPETDGRSSSRGMRVLVTNDTLAVRGGAVAFARDLARALQRRGHRVMAYTTDPAAQPRLLERDPIPVVTDPERLPLRPDVIHAQHHLDAVVALAALPGVPAICHCRGAVWRERPPLHPRIHRYVAVTPTLGERLSVEYALAPERVRVVPNDVDLERFAGIRRPPARPARVLFYSHRHMPGSPTIRRGRSAQRDEQAAGPSLDVRPVQHRGAGPLDPETLRDARWHAVAVGAMQIGEDDVRGSAEGANAVADDGEAQDRAPALTAARGSPTLRGSEPAFQLRRGHGPDPPARVVPRYEPREEGPMAIVLTPSVYSGPGTEGDFGWMVEQARWKSSLFIFNDNESQSQAFLTQAASGTLDPQSSACRAGGGNAVIRPWQCQTPPRAAGVPTGPGYSSLTDQARSRIDAAIAHVSRLLASGRFTEVVYSASGTDAGVLGHGIFSVGEDVLRYVPAELRRIVDEANRARDREQEG